MGYEPIKEETKEQYLKIWTHYCIAHFNQAQLAELFHCSQDTVANAISWAAENRTKFQTSVLAEAAKESLENKLQEFRSDLLKIKGNTPVNWNAVIGMNKLINDVEELLWKLQAVIQDRSIITLNTMQVNQVSEARDEIIEGIDDEKKKELISKIREAIGESKHDPKGAE